jgi:hypothetical protein
MLKAGCLSGALKMLLASGRDPLVEPIFSGVLHTIQTSAWQGLKRRARILIPESATLIGVVDETGTLGPNEIFVQIRRDSFHIDTKSVSKY